MNVSDMYLLHTCIWYICMHICTYNICTYNICIYEREMCVCVLCCYDIYSVARRWIVTHKRWTRHTQVLMWTFCGVRRNSWILIRRTLVGTIDPRQKKTWEIHPQDGERFTKDFCGLVGVQYCEQIARCHFWLSHSRYGNRTQSPWPLKVS